MVNSVIEENGLSGHRLRERQLDLRSLVAMMSQAVAFGTFHVSGITSGGPGRLMI